MDNTEKLLLGLVAGVSIYFIAVGLRRTDTAPKIEPTTLEKRVMGYRALIWKEGVRQAVEPALVAAVMSAESSGVELGARYLENVDDYVVGLMQIRMATAGRVCDVWHQYNLKKPEVNIACGTKYLRQMLNYFRGTVKLAVSAYMMGPGGVYVDSMVGGGMNIANPNYVNTVLSRMLRYRLLFKSYYAGYDKLFPPSKWLIGRLIGS